MREDCIKKVLEVGNKEVCAAFVDYIANSIWAGCLVTTKLEDGLLDFSLAKGGVMFYWIRVLYIRQDEVMYWGWGEERLSDNNTFFLIGIGFYG